jgi:hypothetical protein
MSILTFIKRIWRPYAKNIEAQTLLNRVRNEPILTERERDAKILELLDDPKPTGETIGQLAKLIKQTDESRF